MGLSRHAGVRIYGSRGHEEVQGFQGSGSEIRACNAMGVLSLHQELAGLRDRRRRVLGLGVGIYLV